MFIDFQRKGDQHPRTIAYLANSFPEALEPYVGEEIRELENHGCQVLACAMRKPRKAPSVSHAGVAGEPLPATPTVEPTFSLRTLYVFPLKLARSVQASFWLASHLFVVRDLLWRAVRGPEPLAHRLRALVHSWLGVYFALELRRRNILHIHVHHGYFSAWVGMVAARILGIEYSLTLHGSDLLVRPRYLDVKLKNCQFCITVSEFNQQFIRENYPGLDTAKVFMQRLGIDTAQWAPRAENSRTDVFRILTVGRLHPVKNQSFLLLACRALKSAGTRFRCLLAGEGPERQRLERLIVELDLRSEVTLLGHVPREQLPRLYADADVVVLTSHSEGLPVTLMEAMAMERIVIAPQITGMPELVILGKTGFLYQPNSMEDLLTTVHFVANHRAKLNRIRKAARQHIEEHFDRRTNLTAFAIQFLGHVNRATQRPSDLIREETHENPLLQQI